MKKVEMHEDLNKDVNNLNNWRVHGERPQCLRTRASNAATPDEQVVFEVQLLITILNA